MWCAKHGNLERLLWLLARGAKVDDVTTHGTTSLLLASEAGHVDVVRELLAHGAFVDASLRACGSTSLLLVPAWQASPVPCL